MGQFNFPMGGYSVAEQFQLVRMLLLFLSAFIYAFSLVSGVQQIFFLRCSACWHLDIGSLVWGNYAWIGLATDRPPYLLISTYANGWLGFMDADTISRFTGKGTGDQTGLRAHYLRSGASR
jgi:hypothetical protein